MKSVKTVTLPIIFFLMALFVVLFIVHNDQGVKFRFFTWESREFRLGLSVFFVFIAGALMSGAFFLVEAVRLRLQLRKEKRNHLGLQREIDGIRNQPLYEDASAPVRSEPKIEAASAQRTISEEDMETLQERKSF